MVVKGISIYIYIPSPLPYPNFSKFFYVLEMRGEGERGRVDFIFIDTFILIFLLNFIEIGKISQKIKLFFFSSFSLN
jgi:hypothetical protein